MIINELGFELTGAQKKVIQEIARILKPEGILILSAPMTWPLHEEPYDFFRYTIHGLRHLLQNENFEIQPIE